MLNPLVSVIVPVYNVEEYLKRCIDSIVNQTYTNIEIIVVNDGSTDGSRNIIQHYARSDKRIVVIDKKNGGQASARNIGLQKMQGSYVIMVDSDDYIDEQLIEKCLEVVRVSKSDLVIFDRFEIHNRGKMKFFSEGLGTTLVEAGSVPWNKFYKAELWNSCIFPEGFWYEDLGIVPYIVTKAKNPIKLNLPLYVYEMRRGTSQGNQVNPRKLLDVYHMLNNVYYKIEENKNPLNSDLHHQLELLYIKHLVNITLLNTLPKVNDREVRKNIAMEIIKIMDNKFPGWYRLFTDVNSPKKIIQKAAIYLYANKKLILGDIIWKYPQWLLYKITSH